MKNLFDRAVNEFVRVDITLFRSGLHEQTLVSRLAYHLQNILPPEIENYFVDVEYNRAHGGVQKFQTQGGNRVFVDLVLHGRGQNGNRENIICSEVKKRDCKDTWASPIDAANFIFPNAQKEGEARQKLLIDENKLISFTSNENAHNLHGIVQGYELGVLLVPRYHEYTRNGVKLAKIPQVFLRYYRNGNYIIAEDRIININI